MVMHSESLFDLAKLQQQDGWREAEIRRLARAARQNRAKFLAPLLLRLLAAAKGQLKLQARPNSVTPDLADLYR